MQRGGPPNPSCTTHLPCRPCGAKLCVGGAAGGALLAAGRQRGRQCAGSCHGSTTGGLWSRRCWPAAAGWLHPRRGGPRAGAARCHLVSSTPAWHSSPALALCLPCVGTAEHGCPEAALRTARCPEAGHAWLGPLRALTGILQYSWNKFLGRGGAAPLRRYALFYLLREIGTFAGTMGEFVDHMRGAAAAGPTAQLKLLTAFRPETVSEEQWDAAVSLPAAGFYVLLTAQRSAPLACTAMRG